ncbi:MAG: hypothetical protein MRJ93_13070 [Nitrososphaeraceae archaeon]|nr:hypothetical protein [Nitrososphaeraceae archaeon]
MVRLCLCNFRRNIEVLAIVTINLVEKDYGIKFYEFCCKEIERIFIYNNAILNLSIKTSSLHDDIYPWLGNFSICLSGSWIYPLFIIPKRKTK